MTPHSTVSESQLSHVIFLPCTFCTFCTFPSIVQIVQIVQCVFFFRLLRRMVSDISFNTPREGRIVSYSLVIRWIFVGYSLVIVLPITYPNRRHLLCNTPCSSPIPFLLKNKIKMRAYLHMSKKSSTSDICLFVFPSLSHPLNKNSPVATFAPCRTYAKISLKNLRMCNFCCTFASKTNVTTMYR